MSGDGASNDGASNDGASNDGASNDGASNDGDGDGSGGGEVAGEYWMRTDIGATLTKDVILSSVVIRSQITAYSVVRVTESGGQYEMTDWQCHVTTTQTCQNDSCTSASTEALPDETRAYAPSKRTLSVQSDGSWSATACAAAVGWEWDCATEEEIPLPTSDSDERVYNPGGGQRGVDIAAEVSGLECSATVVQLVDVTYEGSLAGGTLASGVVRDQGSVQQVLTENCGGVPDPVPDEEGTLRMVPAQRAISGDPMWDCPTLAEFEQALPNP